MSDDRFAEPRRPAAASSHPPSHPPSPRRPPAPGADRPQPAQSAPTGPRRAALLFALAFVAAALLYWPAFEARINLPDALYGAPLAVVALTALADAVLGRRPFARSLWIGAAVLPAVVFARVVHDGLRDPTSHNLWPLEIAIAVGVGLPAALAGVVLGWLALRLTGRGRVDAG